MSRSSLKLWTSLNLNSSLSGKLVLEYGGAFSTLITQVVGSYGLFDYKEKVGVVNSLIIRKKERKIEN